MFVSKNVAFFGRYFRLTREPGVSRIFRIRGIWEKNVLYQFWYLTGGNTSLSCMKTGSDKCIFW